MKTQRDDDDFGFGRTPPPESANHRYPMSAMLPLQQPQPRLVPYRDNQWPCVRVAEEQS